MIRLPRSLHALRSAVAPCLVSRVPCALLCAVIAVGCGGETATPTECEDLPQYDIRNSSQEQGAVKDVGDVPNSPVPLAEQRRLQRLAGEGCVTLPHKSFSLKSTKVAGLHLDPSVSDSALALDAIESNERDAGL
jgi:hypothetical protein